jgi:hypothetical protein
VVQGDRNFVINGPGGNQIWSSNSGKHTVFNNVHLILQADGNLVLYNPMTEGRNDKPIWASNTNGKDIKPTLTLLDDGNLVLFGSKHQGEILWASNTA